MRSPRPAARIIALTRGAARLAVIAGSTRSATNAPSDANSRWFAQAADDVAERARHVRQVAGLAVAVPQPREDAARLQVPLDAHQVEPAQELRIVGTGRYAGRLRRGAEFERPAHHVGRWPGDVAVAQQRHEVVGERPVHRVLEIEDAGIASAADHQVARMVVAMHEHLRLRRVHWPPARRNAAGQHRRLARRQLERQVPAQQPVGEQAHLEAQQALVVRRQAVARAGARVPGSAPAPQSRRRTGRRRGGHRRAAAR